MKSNTLALVLLLVIVGGGLTYLMIGGSNPAPLGNLPAAEEENPQSDAPDLEIAEDFRGDPEVLGSADEGGRETIPVIGEEIRNWGDAAQGAMGLVTDQGGIPQAGIMVYLVEAIGNPLQALQAKQKGVVIPALAADITDNDGRFTLGLRSIREDTSYQLQFVDERNRFVDRGMPGIHLAQDQWYETEPIRLTYGLAVRGSVRSQANGGSPIEGATVTIRGIQNTPTLTPIPNREQGLTAVTDHNGYYQFSNAPERGLFTLTAVAEGHAMESRMRVKIEQNKDNIHDFNLMAGMTITGIVTDKDGEPIVNATVKTRSLSKKTVNGDDQWTDREGRFELMGLNEGPYGLTVVSPNFSDYHVKGIMAGTEGHHIVMEQRGIAKLRVVGAGGRALTRYVVHLKKSSKKAAGALTNLGDQAPITVTSRDLEAGVFTMGGLEEGSYAFEVQSKSFAKTYSPPFDIVLGQEAPLVEVQMLRGGSILGKVVGGSGKGLSGAVITTLPNQYMENPITKMFDALIQTTITRTSTKSKGGGNFALEALAPGTYQLKIEHPNHVTLYLKDMELLPDQKLRMTPISLADGTKVTGIAMVNGKATAQIKVEITSRGRDGGPSENPFSASAISDVNGFFAIAQRLPPGNYQAVAARQTLENVFMQFTDQEQTRTEFTVAAGQTEHQLNFYIQRN